MEMHNLLQFFREQMEIWNRIPYTLERNGIPFIREHTVSGQPSNRMITVGEANPYQFIFMTFSSLHANPSPAQTQL